MSGLACPHCGNPKSIVRWSRRREGAVRRGRRCAKCNEDFGTREVIDGLIPKELHARIKAVAGLMASVADEFTMFLDETKPDEAA